MSFKKSFAKILTYLAWSSPEYLYLYQDEENRNHKDTNNDTKI